MSDGHRDGNGLSSPLIPIVYMEIRSADGRLMHPYQHIIDPRLGNGDRFQPKARFRPTFHKSVHGIHEEPPPQQSLPDAAPGF